MECRRLSNGLRVALTALAANLLVTVALAAPRERVLHNFKKHGRDGSYPGTSLIFDAAGNLYGTTFEGGIGVCKYGNSVGCGTVFELMPKSGGGWTEAVLHTFSPDGIDGIHPTSSLIFDAMGNLYGTTIGGGAHGVGTVFELTPAAGRGWTEAVLYDFGSNGSDGIYPYAGLIIVFTCYQATLIWTSTDVPELDVVWHATEQRNALPDQHRYARNGDMKNRPSSSNPQ